MNTSLDLLIELGKKKRTVLANYGLMSVIPEEVWREFVYKCLCNGVTEEQIEELKKLGFSEKEIFKMLQVGMDCGTCTREDKNECDFAKSETKDDK